MYELLWEERVKQRMRVIAKRLRGVLVKILRYNHTYKAIAPSLLKIVCQHSNR